ncbi:ferredoxin [Streptomyces sp. NPDC002055]|uniref:ferredoxin n=1 Tax=Streptomyces sp. NPDC002055 TaxID=3154534 RepID=UPI00332F3CA5
MNVAVDPERCCGSGMCALTAPAVFDQRRGDGTVLLLDSAPGEERSAEVEAAALNCPCEAITITP